MSDKKPKSKVALETEWKIFQKRSSFLRQPKLALGQTGIGYIILKEGRGEKVGGNKTALTYYTAFHKGDWTVFDTNTDKDPFRFDIGLPGVIQGFSITVADMKKGEMRISLFPSSLAYGEDGSRHNLPPDAELIFEIELVDFFPRAEGSGVARLPRGVKRLM